MARPAKDTHAISLKISTPVYNRLNQHCDDTGITKTAIIEKAITEYLNRYDKERVFIERNMK